MTRIVATRSAATRTEDIRRHNLGRIVDQVHRRGRVSRAELTADLGLNRSTIGALVAELADIGLVHEVIPTGGDRAGRPSHMVAPHREGPFAFAADVQVGQLTVAAIALGGEQLARREITLGSSDAATVAGELAAQLGLLRRDLLGGGWPIGVGVSVPGTVRLDDGHVEFAPNLAWHGVPFGSMLSDRLALPVSVGNDADLGVLAEHLRGAACDSGDVVFLAGRVGVGAGILVDGLPLRGVGGLAGEVGHTVLDPAGPLCHCGSHGCVEMFIGDAALLRLANHRRRARLNSVDDVIAAADAGEVRALMAIDAVAEALGRVVANIVNLLNPQLVVMGGTLREVLRLSHDRVEESVSSHAMAASRTMVVLRTSGLAHDSSLIGAADRAFVPLLADPSAFASDGAVATSL